MANSASGLGAFGCPRPFLSAGEFPYVAGERAGRFCGNITTGLACCLPCPIEDWVYSGDFERKLDVAYWLNIPAFVCQIVLLVTFAVLPRDVSHAHHLSVGLCVSLMLVELSFIVALGTKPDMCYDQVTPRDMYTSMSCAWSGALLVTGAISVAVWIMLRSLWTHLRVCWDVKQTRTFFWATQAIGCGLPGLFLALCIPITGVSYRIGTTCIPNQKNAFVTWFGWIIAFACLAALLQFATTIFCLWLYLKDVLGGSSTVPSTTTSSQPPTISGQDRKLAWRRVRNVLSLQWRSIVLTTLVIIECVYFGVIFIHESSSADRLARANMSDAILNWAYCLIRNGGRREGCQTLAEVLGLEEDYIIAAFAMTALIGICTFALMLRRSMLVGWYHLARHPRRPSLGEEDFVFVSPKRRSFGRPLESEKPQQPQLNIDSAVANHRGRPLLSPVSPVSPVLPEATTPAVEQDQNGLGFGGGGHEAAEVDRRHRTTDWFDDDDKVGGDGERRRVSKLDDLA